MSRDSRKSLGQSGYLGNYIQAEGVARAGEMGLYGHRVWVMLHECQSILSPGGEEVGVRREALRVAWRGQLGRECSLCKNNLAGGPRCLGGDCSEPCLDHGGDTDGGGTQRTWADVASPACTVLSASFTELDLVMAESAPGLSP